MEFMLITLAFSVMAGLLMSRAAKVVNLPSVTAYLIAGLCIGPFLLGRLGIKVIGFSSLEYVDSFSIISLENTIS